MSEAGPSTSKKKRTIPKILDGTYYEIVKEDEDNVDVKCCECGEIKKGNIKTTGNFLTHYQKKHPASVGNLREHLEKKSSDSKKFVQRPIVGPALPKEQVRQSFNFVSLKFEVMKPYQ